MKEGGASAGFLCNGLFKRSRTSATCLGTLRNSNSYRSCASVDKASHTGYRNFSSHGTSAISSLSLFTTPARSVRAATRTSWKRGTDIEMPSFLCVPHHRTFVTSTNDEENKETGSKKDMVVLNLTSMQNKAAQERIKYWTVFGGLAATGTAVAEYLLQSATGTPFLSGSFILVVLGTTAVNYLIYNRGGERVAESMGGQLFSADTYGRSSIGPSRLRPSEVTELVHELSQTAGLPVTPPLYLIPTTEMNAFAAGMRKEKAIVAITGGLLESLTKDELRAVLAHEIGHIANGDVRTGTALAAMNMGFYGAYFLGRAMLQTARYRRSNDEKGKGGNPIAPILVGVGLSTYALGTLLQLFVSRTREFEADACGAAFAGDTSSLVSALKKIAGRAHFAPDSVFKRNAQFSHLYFTTPEETQSAAWTRVGGLRKLWTSVSNLFMTHPPIERRIEALQRLDVKTMALQRPDGVRLLVSSSEEKKKKDTARKQERTIW